MINPEINITVLPDNFHWWPFPWGRAHLTEVCVSAFMENPGRFGIDRMRTGKRNRVLRQGRGLCQECAEQFIAARYKGHLHGQQRKDKE